MQDGIWRLVILLMTPQVVDVPDYVLYIFRAPAGYTEQTPAAYIQKTTIGKVRVECPCRLGGTNNYVTKVLGSNPRRSSGKADEG